MAPPKTRKIKNAKCKLEILFEKVMDKFYKLRSKNPDNFDGQGYWQPIKKLLEPLDSHCAKGWKKISASKTHTMMSLPEYTIDGYDTKKMIAKNHFIIQQVRIPLNEKPNAKKIVQIALNIGQHKGSNNGVNEYKFNSINQFVEKSDIIELSKHISDETFDNIIKYLSD
jgi:hypothetical protein